MSPGGWLALILGVGGSSLALAWCLWRVLRTPGASERIHAPPDLEPRDPA